MIIIAVDSVYQLIASLNIAYTEFPNREYTLLFRNRLWNTNKKLELKNNKLIANVFYTNERYDNNITGRLDVRLWNILSLVAPQKAINKLFNNNVTNSKITAIISSTCVNYLEVLYNSFKGQNPSIYLVEEGLGEYIYKVGINKHKNMKQKIKSIVTNSKKINRKAIRRFLLPDYVESKNFEVQGIPYISIDKFFRKELLNLFNSGPALDRLKNKDIIYFEQPFSAEPRCNTEIAEQLNIIESFILEKCFNNKNSIVKLHPRSNSNLYRKFETIYSTAPWEALMPSIELEDKILISISSTSIITPKLMLNEEPTIICLVEIFGKCLNLLNPYMTEDALDKIKDLFFYVKHKYSNPERFFIPNTIEELDNFLLKMDNK